MFYQTHSCLATDGLKLENGIDFNFPLHLHSSFELIVVTEGQMDITVDGTLYNLKQEDAVLVFPNQVHELRTPEHSCHFLCIFSPNLVQAYNKLYTSKTPVSNLFKPDFSLIEKLASIKKDDSIMKVKGCLYSICGCFDECAQYTDKTIANDGLLAKICRFVEENYSSDCSLDALSRFTSYHYVYLSKYFKSSTGTSFTDYVNRHRVSEACYLLQNSDRTILQTAYDCGFDSLRSFNRNFKNIMGITPSEYQKNSF